VFAAAQVGHGSSIRSPKHRAASRHDRIRCSASPESCGRRKTDTPRGLKPHGFSGHAQPNGSRSRLKAVPPPKWTFELHRGVAWVARRPPLKRSAPRPRCVTAFTRGHDLPRNPQNSIQLVRCKGVPWGILTRPGKTGKGTSILARAMHVRRTTGTKPPWRARALSVIRRDRAHP
jgi:hypothetical protein